MSETATPQRKIFPDLEDMFIAIVGHVDHGKSTIIGRLLTDTGSLPQGKLEAVKEQCQRNSKPFEYAFLLDALKDEQAQGITIDSARVFFRTNKRRYIILDTPGHIEFLKNMITGASRAEAALLVIDAKEGIQENSRRHGYLLAMLGIKQIVVLVNKMDLIDYSQKKYENIITEYSQFLNKIGVTVLGFLPVSGMKGDNIVKSTENLKWFHGNTLLQQIDAFEGEKTLEEKPLRIPIQGVYKFTNRRDNRRIIAGTIETGRFSIGNELVFYPSGKKSIVRSIESFNSPPITSQSAGFATGIMLQDQIYVRRGEVAVRSDQTPPKVATRFQVNIFWLGQVPMKKEKNYYLKIGTQKVRVQLETIQLNLDASTLDHSIKQEIQRHDVIECILRTERPIVFDLTQENVITSRFVIVDNYEIWGGGIITATVDDLTTSQQSQTFLTNDTWESGFINIKERMDRYKHRPIMLIITGPKEVQKENLAKALERHLFQLGKMVYYLGLRDILSGVDVDVGFSSPYPKEEYLQRLGEIANVFTDSGLIFITTATELTNSDMQIIETSINPDKILCLWIGDNITTDLVVEYRLDPAKESEQTISRIILILKEKNIVFQ